MRYWKVFVNVEDGAPIRVICIDIQYFFHRFLCYLTLWDIYLPIDIVSIDAERLELLSMDLLLRGPSPAARSARSGSGCRRRLAPATAMAKAKVKATAKSVDAEVGLHAFEGLALGFGVDDKDGEELDDHHEGEEREG
jgi:hypothetical protein